jgi:hypothetical protein
MDLKISPAAISGGPMNAACDPPLTDSTLASIRLAMNRSQSGGMALSCSETMHHVGRSFQLYGQPYGQVLAFAAELAQRLAPT